MKRITFAAIAILLCVLVLLGILIGPSPKSEPEAESIASSLPSIESGFVVSAEEPGISNEALLMIDLTVDLYRLPADAANDVLPYLDSWQAFCDALDSQSASFTFNSTEEKAVLLNASRRLLTAEWFSVSGTGLEIDLTYAENYADDSLFLKAIAESIIRENIYADATQLEIALLLYTYLVTNVELTDNAATTDGVFNDYAGNGAAIADAMVFLLTQFDIPALSLKGEKEALLAAQIGNQCLYFSPAAEISGGYLRGLTCFAMEKSTAHAVCGRFEPPTFAENSEAYTLGKTFSNCTDWRLDAAGHYLYLAYDSSEFTGAISTADMSAANG